MYFETAVRVNGLAGRVLRPRLVNVRITSHVLASTCILLQLISTILIAARESREHNTPSDAPKKQLDHIPSVPSSITGGKSGVQDLGKSKHQGTVANLQHEAYTKHMSGGDPVGQGVHETVQSGRSGSE